MNNEQERKLIVNIPILPAKVLSAPPMLSGQEDRKRYTNLRPPRGVCEALLHQSQKPCGIGASPSNTYGSI